MAHIQYRALLVSFLITLVSIQSCGTSANPPNVIVIMTDDQGYGDMSCHGNPDIETPEMDRLYAEGVRFTDFHVDPTCSPTRAALMTGRYSARVGVWLTYASRNHLRRDEVTMADVFKQNGYATGVFGKWHLGDNYPFRPGDRGFDESLIHGGGVVGEAPDYWDNNCYDDVYVRNGEPEKVEGYCTDVWFNAAMTFIEKYRERPFFVYIPTNAAHAPFHVPERYRKSYVDRGINQSRAAFYGMIGTIDENLGRLREYLKEQSLDRNTIVVFLTDNGTANGVSLSTDDTGNRNDWTVNGYNAGMRGKKTSAYEGGHRAACFIHWPQGGLTGGRDIDGVTAHIDLLPTLIDVCGLDFNDQSRFDGMSLKQVLEDKNAQLPKRSVVVHNQGRFGNRIEDGLLIKDKDYSVMQGKWRLVGNELYDLSDDPGQRNNIAEQHSEIANNLRNDYETWWESIAEKADEYCPFVVNPAKQPIVTITSQNLLGGDSAYSQRHVRGALGNRDSWTVIEVETPGRYRISLRRWPKEVDKSIHAGVPNYPQHPSTHVMSKGLREPCKILDVVSARLQVGDFDETVPVNEHDKKVVFEVALDEGERRIQTWFMMENDEPIAAYYTDIEPM
jgi:arylsulfatase A-like enzyme